MEGVAEDKCALVAELVQVLELVRQLEAHMAAGQQAGDHQRCRALVSGMRAAVDRAVHMAVSSCCAEGCRPAVGHGHHQDSPPSGGDGSPRSAGSDQAGAGGNAAGGGQGKKRKMLPRVSTQVRVSAVQDVSPLDDGLSWRKYGQKDILGAKYPRAYFRCTHRHTQSCCASKQVQRTDGDPLLFDVVYHGTHTCAQGAAAAAHHPSDQHHGARAAPAQVQPAAAADRVPPFSLVNDAGAATSSRFVASGGGGGCVAASPFASSSSSPATPECLHVSSSYAVGGGGGMPDVELVSSTNSPMCEMEEFMFPLDTADFLENPSSYF